MKCTKRILAVLMALLMLVNCAAVAYAGYEDGMNCPECGKYRWDDWLALRAAVRMETFWNQTQSAKFKAADTNKDSKVNAADARRILRAAVKLEDPKTW